MAIFKTFRFMYRNALNSRLILVACWSPAINGNLGNDTIVKMLLQSVDSKSVYITSVNKLLKQQVNIQLIIMLFPRVVTKMFPRFEGAVYLADSLQDRLRSKTCYDILPFVIFINGIGEH